MDNFFVQLDFGKFVWLLMGQKYEEAKVFVKPENIKSQDQNNRGILWYVCAYGPDDPWLLRYFRQVMRVPFFDETNDREGLLFQSVGRCKPKVARALIDMGVEVDARICLFRRTVLEMFIFDGFMSGSMKILIDAGAKVPQKAEDGWSGVFQKGRALARGTTIGILGLRRCGARVVGKSNGGNVLWLIARCLWSTRCDDIWTASVWRGAKKIKF